MMRGYKGMNEQLGSAGFRTLGSFGENRSVGGGRVLRWVLLALSISTVGACSSMIPPNPLKPVEHEPLSHELVKPTCERIITADVVSLEQVYYYNRFGSFNPAGLMYALRRDVVIERESLDEVIQSLDAVIQSLEEELRRWPEENRNAKSKILEVKKKDKKDLIEEIIRSLDSDIDSLDKELTRWPKLNQAANKKILEAKKKNRVELHEMLLAADKKTSRDKATTKSEQEETENKPEVVNGDLDLDVNIQKTTEINLPLDGKRSLDRYLAGHVKLRSDKRPRPLVLRANEGDCLQVTFTNLLSPYGDGSEIINDPAFRLTHPKQVVDEGNEKQKVRKPVKDVLDSDEPATRHASMHVNGLSLVDSIDSQGANVGRNGWYRTNEDGTYELDSKGERIKDKDAKCSSNPLDFGRNLCALAAPGETRTYAWHAKKEGTYFFYSMGAPAGGEGDGGQLGLGLFGAVNVQPEHAKWYRSQVTHDDLLKATLRTTPSYGQPVINYEVVAGDGTPILNMVKVKQEEPGYEKEAEINNEKPCRKGEYQTQHEENPVTHKIKWTCKLPAVYEIVHSDLNAVIDIQSEKNCEQQGEGNACGKPYREFTVIFHDEVTAVQAFEELDNEDSGVSSLRDGMGINYGASGLGPMVIANRKKIGPSRDCVECKLEEFFLTSWVHGDPAMVVGYKRGPDGNLIPDCGQNESGTCQEKGSKHLTSPVIMPNGTIFKRLPNGDIRVTEPKGTTNGLQLEGTIFKDLSKGTTFNYLGDGATDVIRLEGTTFRRRLDGSIEEIRTDGTRSPIRLEATVYKRHSDKTIFKYLADGTIDKIQVNGKSSKLIPGEVTFTFPYLYKKEAKYPDDPSNVHHSYLGDPVRFRNMHAGPKETHVFHLHAHQWVEDKHDPSSHYLDSQTISPGSTFSYDVHYGGSGNRNLGPGDSIFHCHLYPHFAQGMWELWRTHDVFEDGLFGRRVFDPKKLINDETNNFNWRNLPDAEIEEGTPNPAIVPLPRTPLPPMPILAKPKEKTKDGTEIEVNKEDSSKSFRGYPFYIAGEKGHRPPQAPLDLEGYDKDETKSNKVGKETLRRHIIVGNEGISKDGVNADEIHDIIVDVAKGEPKEIPKRESELYRAGKQLSNYTARRVFRDNQNRDFFGLARQLESVHIHSLEEAGERQEITAMQFHAGELILPGGDSAMKPGGHGWTHTNYNWDAPGYKTCLIDSRLPKGFDCGQDGSSQPILFRVSGPGKRDDSNSMKDNPQKNNDEHHEKSVSAKTEFGMPGAPFANPCPTHFVDENGRVSNVMTRKYRAAYIQMDMTVNKAGWHDPQARFPVLEEDVRETLDGSRPTEPLFFRANSGECIEFKATNLIPSNLNLDDFQVYSPTDTIGQHIHLVKFDVTSSDGSGNGWNYEDGTLAADEVRERITAHNNWVDICTNKLNTNKNGPNTSQAKPDPDGCPNKVEDIPKKLKPKTHPMFLDGGVLAHDPRGECPDSWDPHEWNKHPWCGAQTTIQRWWADPLLNGKPGDKEREGEDRRTSKAKHVKDRTLRTVFTHDHFGPSSHQHHGFYAALVVEPRNSKWYFLNGQQMGGVDEDGKPVPVKDPKTGKEHQDGGPTSYAANIIVRDEGKACLNLTTIECSQQLDHKASIDRRRTGREFNLAFADFAIVYTSDLKKEDEPEGNRLRPVNPPSHGEGGVQSPVIPSRVPLPEGISTKDPGTQLINYRNEPIPLRIGEWKPFKSGDAVPSPWSCTSSANGGKSCFVQKNEKIVLEKQILDLSITLDASWSCKPIKPNDNKEEKQECIRERNVGDMAHVFSSKMHEYQAGKGNEIFTECLFGVCPKDREKGDLKKLAEKEKEARDNEKNLVGRQPGDPATPLLQAYDGDRVQIRLIQGAQEEQHVFTMQGARWLAQPDSPDSGFVNAQHIGISEHFEFNDRMLGLSQLPAAELGHGVKTKRCEAKSSEGKKEPCRTDLLFSSSAIDNLWDGQWGLMRVYPAEENLSHMLARLPGNTDKNPFVSVFRDPEFDERVESDINEPQVVKTTVKEVEDPVEAFCLDPARKEFLKTFSVEAWMVRDLPKEGKEFFSSLWRKEEYLEKKGLVYNEKFDITDPHAILFVEQDRKPDMANRQKRPEPLILRARAGDCIQVTLTNKLPVEMPDDQKFLTGTAPADDQKLQLWQKTWSYNMLPPIIEGFNFNQIRSSNRVGLHAGLVDQNLRKLGGSHVGLNGDSTVGPNESKTYLWYAGDLDVRKGKMIGTPIEFGVIPLTDQADVIKHPAHGAIGALVIEPQCSETVVDSQAQEAEAMVTWWEPDPKTHQCPEKPAERTNVSRLRKSMNTLTTPGLWPSLSPSTWSNWWNDEERFDGLHRYKEFVLLYQDALALQQHGEPIPNLRNGDDSEDSGQKAFNYRTEPLWARLGGSAADEPDVMTGYDWSNVLSSAFGCKNADCDPETPLFTATAGELIRFRVAHPGGHPRQHALAIFGHDWALNPWKKGSRVMGYNSDSPTRFGSTNGIGPARHLNILTRAGGDCAVPGDYLYRTQEGFMFGGGLWGIFRVDPAGEYLLKQNPQAAIYSNKNACKVELPSAN